MIKSCIPNRKISARRKNKTVIPFSKNTVNLIRKKHRLWLRYHETRDINKLNNYWKARNKLKGQIRKEKCNYEKQLAKHVKENPKVFWKYVNRKLCTRAGIPDLKITMDGATSLAIIDADKAEAVSSHFA